MKKQAKTEILSCRVTPEQREMIEEKAYSSYRTPSMYLRDCALDKKIVVINGVDEFASKLRKIGNNINQIARKINSKRFFFGNFNSVIEGQRKIYDAILDLKGDDS